MLLFYDFHFERNYVVLKSKSPCFLLKKIQILIKTKRNQKMENATHNLRDELELARETRGHFLYRLFCPNEIFLTIVFYLNAYCIQCIMYSEYTCFYISINITSYAFLLVFKIVENHQCILNCIEKLPLILF